MGDIAIIRPTFIMVIHRQAALLFLNKVKQFIIAWFIVHTGSLWRVYESIEVGGGGGGSNSYLFGERLRYATAYPHNGCCIMYS